MPLPSLPFRGFARSWRKKSWTRTGSRDRRRRLKVKPRRLPAKCFVMLSWSPTARPTRQPERSKMLSAASKTRSRGSNRCDEVLVETKAPCRGHGLWDGQVPRLAGQGEENYPAHPGMGNERSAERHLLPFGLPLGQEARSLHLPQQETA